MAPALTKILKNGHGIHLSSPPASVRMDSDRRTMCFIEPAPRATSTEDGDIQKVLLNISSFQFLESCSPSSLLDVSVNPVFSPCRKASASQCETDSLLSPGSFAELFSFNQDQRDFQALCSAFPGVPGMFLAPSPQHNGQEACVQHGQSAAPACRPDGGDVHYSSLTFSSVCPSYSHGEIKSQGCGALFATPAALTQVKQVTGAGCPPSASLRPCVGWATLDRPACKAGLQDALEEQLSRQAGLQDRAGKLQRRLQGLLGEQAVRHCSQQLEGLKRNPQHGKVFLDGSAPADPDVLPPQAATKSPFYWERSSKHLDFFAEVGEFSQCSQLMLRDLQTALDSEATASSSSDEEPEEHHGRTSPTISRCEKQWLEERAELGSRWSWLHLHLAELERRIQQLIGVHRRIRSSKGGVVLADSQPLTDQQIQQTLMKEITGLSCTGSDADIEACSPTRLLHNIERQSAHLNQIVNSLMPNFSPLSKQPTSWKGKRTSGQRGDVLLPESSKRRRLTNRRLFKADVSCVCARTRPLVSYHKPKLFTLTPLSSSSLLDSINSTSTLSSCLLSSSCSCCSLCDPVVLCSDLDCSTSRIPSSSTSRATETSMCHCSQRVRGMQGQFVLDIKSSRSAKYKRHSSTPLLHGHKYKNHARHHRKIILGLSPIRASGSHRTQPTRFSQKRRKRKHNRVVDDEEDVQYQLYDPEENSDDLLKESYTYASHKRASQGFVRGHRGESVYSINSVLMPMSLTKVEKLQYKDILTPRWRLVETPSLLELETVNEASSEEVQVEDLSDEAFAQRHMALEQKEKLRWPSWGKRKCHTRSGSRLSGSVCGMYTSGEESSVECSAQLDADEQSKSEEQLPQIPWEPRVFPLDEDEEALSLSNGQQKAPSGWTESSEDLSTSSSSDVYPDQWSGAALPPRGQCGSSTPNGSIPCRIAHV
ncbi:KAT8 regulatory NSL complex subunit 1-like protein isoform X2 [Salarias fasciatus]|uniref:KAT8 regulatory NSL complex subunit 1-like protein isoform X2 n=1 Tax=Salarias fasciatus TaxID=181472 RepID=UPI001176A8B2|nr:KAT8 regulatory NSL complex subunit 1-like protein isoform X2 [Salarias fasciatus]